MTQTYKTSNKVTTSKQTIMISGLMAIPLDGNHLKLILMCKSPDGSLNNSLKTLKKAIKTEQTPFTRHKTDKEGSVGVVIITLADNIYRTLYLEEANKLIMKWVVVELSVKSYMVTSTKTDVFDESDVVGYSYVELVSIGKL